MQARSASEFPAADITSAHPRPSQGVLNAALEQYAIDARTSLAYMSLVILIETPVFTRLVTKTLSDEDYRRSSNGWLTVRMLGIWSGVAPECEKLDGLCRVEARAAVFACCTTGARTQTRSTSSSCLAKESGLISRRYRFVSWQST